MDADSEYLTIAEAARILGCGRRPLYRYAKSGDLKAIRINDRGDLRTTRAWLEDFIELRPAHGSVVRL